jgi:hypothetical protein
MSYGYLPPAAPPPLGMVARSVYLKIMGEFVLSTGRRIQRVKLIFHNEID